MLGGAPDHHTRPILAVAGLEPKVVDKLGAIEELLQRAIPCGRRRE